MMDFNEMRRFVDLLACGFEQCKSIEERNGARHIIGAVLACFRHYDHFDSHEEKTILNDLQKCGYFNAQLGQ